MLSGNKSVADAFMQHFLSVFIVSDSINMYIYINLNINIDITNFIDVSLILNIIKKLPNTPSRGINGIPR